MRKPGLTFLAVALLALAAFGCGGGEDPPTRPTTVAPATTTAPPQAATTTPPEAVPAEEPEGDASGGRALSASFTTDQNPWSAELVNTTANLGRVSYCVYDLEGPGGWGNQGDPVHWLAFEVPPGSKLAVDIYDVYNPVECVLEILSFECELVGEPGEGQVTCAAETNIPAYWSAKWTQALYASDVVTRTPQATSKIEFTAQLPRDLKMLELRVEAYATCGDQLIFQADLIRGPECGQAPAAHAGYNFGAVYGKLEETERSEVQAERVWKFEPPCEEEWIEEKEPEIQEGEWGECVAVEDDRAAGLEQDVLAVATPEKCFGERTRTDVYTWYEVNSCTDARRPSRTEKKTVGEPCEIECPYAEGYCFYNIARQPKGLTCRAKLGGRPLRLGEWGRWPDGPPSDHCRFTVPGIYSDPLRQFQLTPGQSDPRCNRK